MIWHSFKIKPRFNLVAIASWCDPRQEYVTGLQWVLYYYYCGVPSWGWFFPSHYAPFVSDIVGIESFEPEFELGSPFTPFEQVSSQLFCVLSKLA